MVVVEAPTVPNGWLVAVPVVNNGVASRACEVHQINESALTHERPPTLRPLGQVVSTRAAGGPETDGDSAGKGVGAGRSGAGSDGWPGSSGSFCIAGAACVG